MPRLQAESWMISVSASVGRQSRNTMEGAITAAWREAEQVSYLMTAQERAEEWTHEPQRAKNSKLDYQLLTLKVLGSHLHQPTPAAACLCPPILCLAQQACERLSCATLQASAALLGRHATLFVGHRCTRRPVNPPCTYKHTTICSQSIASSNTKPDLDCHASLPQAKRSRQASKDHQQAATTPLPTPSFLCKLGSS